MNQYTASKNFKKRAKKKKTDYSDQKQHGEHNDPQDNNNKETEIERKTTLWKFQVTNTKRLEPGNFKRETEFILIAAQNNAIRTNYIKATRSSRDNINTNRTTITKKKEIGRKTTHGYFQ